MSSSSFSPSSTDYHSNNMDDASRATTTTTSDLAAGQHVYYVIWAFFALAVFFSPCFFFPRRRALCFKRIRERRWNVTLDENDPHDLSILGGSDFRPRYPPDDPRHVVTKEESEKSKREYIETKMKGFTKTIQDSDFVMKSALEVGDAVKEAQSRRQSMIGGGTSPNGNRKLTTSKNNNFMNSIMSVFHGATAGHGNAKDTDSKNVHPESAATAAAATAAAAVVVEEEGGGESATEMNGNLENREHIGNNQAKHNDGMNSCSVHSNADHDANNGGATVESMTQFQSHDVEDQGMKLAVVGMPTEEDVLENGLATIDLTEGCNQNIAGVGNSVGGEASENLIRLLRVPRPGVPFNKTTAEADDAYYREIIPECCICLNDFKPGEVVSWSPGELCTHSFHEKCIVKWFLTVSCRTDARHGRRSYGVDCDLQCPVCRQDFFQDAATILSS